MEENKTKEIVNEEVKNNKNNHKNENFQKKDHHKKYCKLFHNL